MYINLGKVAGSEARKAFIFEVDMKLFEKQRMALKDLHSCLESGVPIATQVICDIIPEDESVY